MALPLLGFSTIGGIVKIATGTKKCLEYLQSYNGIEEEGYYLWKLLDTLNGPLQVAEKFAIRHEATFLLVPALQLCKFAVGKLEGILEVGEVEDDERPDNAASWSKWMLEKKDGKERKERIQEHTPKLVSAMQGLQLVLTSIASQPALAARLEPRANTKLYYVEDAFVRGRRLLEEFAFGRTCATTLCNGVLWAAKEGKKSGAENLGRCQGQLGRDPTERNMWLDLVCMEEDEEEAGQKAWEDIRLPLSHSTPFARCTEEKRLALDIDTEPGWLVYKIGPEHFLEFEVHEKVSCEMFEAIFLLLKESNALQDPFPDTYHQLYATLG